MTITLMENFRAIFYAPFYAAFALGAYVAEGIDVEIRPSCDPDETVQALLTGGGDVVWGGPMRVQVAGDSNPDCGLVSFCEVVERDPFFIVGRGPVPGGGLKGIMGKKIATVSEVPTPWMCFQDDLRQVGLNPDALNRIPDRLMGENADALIVGEVDAVQVFQPLAENLVGESGMQIWYAAAERGLTSYTTFSTTRAFMAREPESLFRMTCAMYRTQKWIAEHSAEDFAECISGYFPNLPLEVLTRSLDRYLKLGIWNQTPLLNREGFDRLRTACISGGLIRRGIPYDLAVDMNFAKSAVQKDPDSM